MVHALLKDFRGVLVSDFYAVYDAFKCPQQKCLIHLMRDINDDMHRYPYDEELKVIAQKYAAVLRIIVETVDRHGLKKTFLGKALARRRGVIHMDCNNRLRLGNRSKLPEAIS